jgi:hypothetical protein
VANFHSCVCVMRELTEKLWVYDCCEPIFVDFWLKGYPEASLPALSVHMWVSRADCNNHLEGSVTKIFRLELWGWDRVTLSLVLVELTRKKAVLSLLPSQDSWEAAVLCTVYWSLQ